MSCASLVRKAVIAHNESRQPVCQRIYAGARLGVRALVRPNDIEARVDTWYGQTVQGRMAETQGCQVICMRKLSRSWWLACSHVRREWPSAMSRSSAYLLYDLLQYVYGQIEQLQRSGGSLLFALRQTRGWLWQWRKGPVSRRHARSGTVCLSVNSRGMCIVLGRRQRAGVVLVRRRHRRGGPGGTGQGEGRRSHAVE